MAVSLENNSVSVTWEQSCQCHLGTIVLVSLGNNQAVSLEKNCTNVTKEQSCQSYLATNLPVPVAVNKKK